MRKFPKFLLAIVILVTLYLMSQKVISQDQQWRPVRGGIAFGISGMALISQQSDSSSFLIVHDNKDKALGRLAIITINGKQQPQYLPLTWPKSADLPKDLESITVLPGAQNPTFMAATSAGKVYHFTLDTSQQNVSIIKVFYLPNIPKYSNFEGFALQKIDGQLLAVWAHRGEDKDPGVIYWGFLDMTTYKIQQPGSARLQVPWPVGPVRHISDLKVDPAGIMFISSATDNGDNGPFATAVYVAGGFDLKGNQITFRQNFQLVPLYRFDYHKVEGMELVPGRNGGIIFGTDDENMGSSVYVNW